MMFVRKNEYVLTTTTISSISTQIENPLIKRFGGWKRIRTKTDYWMGKLNKEFNGAQDPPTAPKPKKRKKK